MIIWLSKNVVYAINTIITYKLITLLDYDIWCVYAYYYLCIISLCKWIYLYLFIFVILLCKNSLRLRRLFFFIAARVDWKRCLKKCRDKITLVYVRFNICFKCFLCTIKNNITNTYRYIFNIYSLFYTWTDRYGQCK